MTTYLTIAIILTLYTLLIFPSMEERRKHPDLYVFWVIVILLFFWATPVLYAADLLGKIIDWVDEEED